MSFLKKQIIITKIVFAAFVPYGSGAPIHKNRPYHGIAYNYHCTTTYTFDDKEPFVCHHGDCIYLPAGSNYKVNLCSKDNPSAGTYAINFLTNDNTTNSPFKHTAKNSARTLSLFMGANKLYQKKNIGFEEMSLSHLYEIFSILKSENETLYPSDKALTILKPCLDYIDSNYISENISTAHLASLCNISEQYLRRLFSKVFSISPSVYIRNMRMCYAKELLESGEYTISDAATLSGFNDIAYFSREFKKATGLTPLSYKNSNLLRRNISSEI